MGDTKKDMKAKLLDMGIGEDKIDGVLGLLDPNTADHNEPVLSLQRQMWTKGEAEGWSKDRIMRGINDALGESIQYAEKQIKDLSEENSQLKNNIRKFRQDNITEYVEDLYNRKVMVDEVYDKKELLEYIEELDKGNEPMSGPLLSFLGRIDNFTEPTEKKDADFMESLSATEYEEVKEFVDKKRLIKSMGMNEESEEDFEKDFEEFKEKPKADTESPKADEERKDDSEGAKGAENKEQLSKEDESSDSEGEGEEEEEKKVDMHEQALSYMEQNKSSDYVEALKAVMVK